MSCRQLYVPQQWGLHLLSVKPHRVAAGLEGELYKVLYFTHLNSSNLAHTTTKHFALESFWVL